MWDVFTEKTKLNKIMALYNDIKHASYANIHMKKGTTSGHETEVCARLTTNNICNNKKNGMLLIIPQKVRCISSRRRNENGTESAVKS